MRIIQSIPSIAVPLLCIGGPSLLAAIYYIFLAQPVYQAEVKFLTLPHHAPANQGAGEVLEAYLYSPGLFEMVHEQYDLRQHYNKAASDPLNHLPPNASSDALRLYFQDKVSLSRSTNSNLLTLSVKAFSSDLAKSLTDSLYLSLQKKWQQINAGHVPDKPNATPIEDTTASASHSLFTVSAAHSPELRVYPRPLRGILAVFVIALLVYGIGRLVHATIRDHNV